MNHVTTVLNSLKHSELQCLTKFIILQSKQEYNVTIMKKNSSNFYIKLFLWPVSELVLIRIWAQVVIKLSSSSTQLSMKFNQLINSKLLISTVVFLFSLAEYDFFQLINSKNDNISWHFHIY